MSKSGSKKSGSFKQKLGSEELAFFNEVAAKPFSEQAVCFLNAYWAEVGSQAEFIFKVSWEIMKKTDMHFTGVDYVHLYDEGINVDFDAGLYFFEKLCKFCDSDEKWSGDDYKISQPTMMTSLVRKKELRNKVDVNFDGKVSMLEYLLYQYQDQANPADFCFRSMKFDDEPQEIIDARLALADVQARIKAYEKRKAELTEKSKGKGVKALKAKNQLAQLECGPLAEELNEALIRAEAAVRKVLKKYKISKKGNSKSPGGTTQVNTNGAAWWLKRDLADKKKRYGKKAK